MRSTNPLAVALIFKDFARSIHAKASPSDPNFLRISVACAKIDQWSERNYPSFVRIPNANISTLSFNPADARSRVAIADAEKDKLAAEEKRHLEIRERFGGNGSSNGALSPSNIQSQGPPWEVLMFVGGAVILIVSLSVGIVLAVLYFTT